MKKVLITYVEAGMGHITTARAVQDILEKYRVQTMEIDWTNEEKTIGIIGLEDLTHHYQ